MPCDIPCEQVRFEGTNYLAADRFATECGKSQVQLEGEQWGNHKHRALLTALEPVVESVGRAYCNTVDCYGFQCELCYNVRIIIYDTVCKRK